MAPLGGVLARLGRVPASFQAPVTGPAAGNSVVRSDVRGEPAAQPGKGTGKGPANASPYPHGTIYDTPWQTTDAARTWYQHGRLTARDRHVAAYRGHTMSGAEDLPTGGSPNPDSEPATPQYRMIDRTLSWQIGTDATRNQDNTAFHASTTAGQRKYPLGQQDGTTVMIYGGQRDLADYLPYGSRGVVTGGPPPRMVAVAGGPHRAGTVLADNPNDGNAVPLWGGFPHGLTLRAPADMAITGKVTRARLAGVRVQSPYRLLASRAAGQTMSQASEHLDGRKAVTIPRTRPGRVPGVSRWR